MIGTKEYINDYKLYLDKKYRLKYNNYGKPYLKKSKKKFNISHCDNLSVMLIINKKCGIDIENIKKINYKIVKKICSNDEQKFLYFKDNKDYYYTLLWTLKEAYLKCLGTGINRNMKNINFVYKNKLNLNLKKYQLSFFSYKNYLISICRKK